MTEEQEKKLDEALSEEFEKVRTASLRTGAKLVCGAVLSMALEKKPYAQRINKIVQFCRTTIGNTEASEANEEN